MRKKYKILVLLGFLAAVVCGALGISACEKIVDSHDHLWGDWHIEAEASCTAEGYRWRTCSVCGDLDEETTKRLDHTPEVTIEARDATCTEPGCTAQKTCSVCKQVLEESEPIEALGHDLQDPEPYSEEGGKYLHRANCSRCDYYTEADCTFELEETAATCTEAAHHKHTCTECGYVYEHDDGVALGHNFGDWVFDIEAYDESCKDEDGEETVVRRHKRVCSNPGHTEDPLFPEVEECTAEEAVGTVKPTCTAAGYTVLKCPTCNATHSEQKVEALGHDWEKDENGQRTYTSEFVDGVWYHYFTCKRDGCPNGGKSTYYKCRYETSTWKNADCEHPKTQIFTCVDCGQRHEVEYGEALGHSYGPWEHKEGTSGEGSMHTRTCQRGDCGKTEEAPCAMISSDLAATCQKPGKAIRMCGDCKYTEEGDEIAQLDHNFEGQEYISNQDKHSHYRICLTCK